MSLPEEVRTARAELLALLERVDPDGAGSLRAERAASLGSVPVVAVVGETNRGKSSLVNALLDTDLSPVDAGTATAVHLVLSHGEELSATAHFADGRTRVPVPPGWLPAWVTGDLPEDGVRPRHLEVQAPVPLLEALTLVDTPGVGGLDGLHAGIAERAAAQATALLLVLDASAPLTRGELGFLQRVSATVETVLVALTKTDAHRGWREVRDADLALLAAHAPRFADAPVFPVSSRLAAMARQAPTPEVAAVLREQSGIAVLQAELQRTVAQRAVMLGEANLLRSVHTALGAAATAESDRARTLRSGTGEADALRARRTELVEQRRSGSRSAAMLLRAEVQRTRVESNHDVSRRIRESQTAFRAAVDAADRATLAGLPAQLDPALAAVGLEVSAGLAQRVQRVVDAVLAEVFTAEEVRNLVAHLARRPPAELGVRPVERRATGSDDKLLVVAGASGGVGLGKLALAPLALIPGLNVVLIPLTLGLGAGAAWWMARARGHVADRAHVKQWSSEVFAEARSALDQLVAEQLIDTEHQVGAALDEALGRRVSQIEAELREIDAALRLDTGERARQLKAADSSAAALETGRTRAATLLARIRAVRDRR